VRWQRQALLYTLAGVAGAGAKSGFSPLGSVPVRPGTERFAWHWFASSDRATGVGARHHTVPAFCLRRFAGSHERLLVRDRPTGRLLPPITVSKLAVTDFYTVVREDGTPDGRMEQLLGKVEGEAAQLLKLLLSPCRRPEPLTEAERFALCQFLAFQMVRGPRKRREMELQADYAARLQAGDALTGQDLPEITAVPHPNEHIRLIGRLSYAIFRTLVPRPVQIVRIGVPLFVTCDEPVLADNGNHVQHLPEHSRTREKLRLRRERANKADTTHQQRIHAWPARPAGVQVADAIAMPLTPSALLVLGRAGEQPAPEVFFDGDDARQLADYVNAALVGQAYEWVAARPDHPSFRDWTFPPPGPLTGMCNGGSIKLRPGLPGSENPEGRRTGGASSAILAGRRIEMSLPAATLQHQQLEEGAWP
jgi:Protein of unknown function (DUF4238)